MSWWQRLFNRPRLESQLDAELREHFDRLVDDFRREGLSEAEARRRARLEFGGLDQVKEACRDERGTRWVEETLQDIRYGLRGLRKHPGFAAVAILTIALGVGANLSIYNLVDALLLRPLAVPGASELVTLTRWNENDRGERISYGASFSYPQVRRLADRTDLFASLAGVASDTIYVGPTEALEPTGAAWVSGRFFETLKLTPFQGRLLTPADDTPAAPPVVVLSHGYWMRKFGGAADIVGRTLTIEGQPVPIVGITPKNFHGATIGESGDVTLAINARPVLQPENEGVTGVDWRWVRILARPAAGLSRETLQPRLDVAWAQMLEAGVSPTLPPEVRKRQLSIKLGVGPGEGGTSRLRGELDSPLRVAMALVTLVLIIACVNVANLLLARGATRAKEVSLRLAIGAGRGRIVRQLLVESAMLAAAGTVAGLLIAWFGSAGLVSLIAEHVGGPEASTVSLDIAPNLRILAVTLLVIAGTTLSCGIVPAWRTSAASPGAVTASTRVAESHGRLASSLIVAQVSLSLLLVIGAGLFARSLHHLRTRDRGFAPGNVLLARFDPSRAGLSPEALRAFNRTLLDEVRLLPGVGRASMSVVTPLQGGGMSNSVFVNGVSMGTNEVYFNIVAPRFFEIVGTPVLDGRDFLDSEDTAAPLVAIVNEAFVRRWVPAGNPIGQHVRMQGDTTERTIVGVVKNAVYESLREEPPATVYLPYAQTRGRPMTMVIDASAPMTDVSTAVRALIQPRVPARPVDINSLASQIERSFFKERLMVILTTIFSTLALSLAAIGLYGLMSYSVTSRTREIGVRLALGARPSHVLRMVLGAAIRMVGAGLVVGLPLALLLSRLVQGMMFGVAPTDPATVISAAVILVLVGIAAAAIPARRAARLDPVTSIHVE